MNVIQELTSATQCLNTNVRDSIGVNLIYPAHMVRRIDQTLIAERQTIIDILLQLQHLSALPYPSPMIGGLRILINNIQRDQALRAQQRNDVQGPGYRTARAA